MLVDEEKAGCWALQPFWNQQESGNRFYAVQIENKSLQRVIIMLFCAHHPRRCWFMLPRKMAEQTPEDIAPLLLIGEEGRRSNIFRSGLTQLPCDPLQAEKTMHVGVPSAWYIPVKVSRPLVWSTRKLVMMSLR